MMTSLKSTALVGAALASIMACYSVSLQASAERAAVAAERQRIAHDLADIRLLRAELRTRSRLPELQRWNEQVLALAPPRAEQLMTSAVQLASYAAPVVHAPAVATAVVRDAPVARAAPLHRVAFVPRGGADLGADALRIGNDTPPAGFQKIALR